MATKKIEIQDSSGNIYYPHTDASVVKNMPTTLKNPNALTIKLNGASQGAYDGGAVKEINITPGGIGAAATAHTHDDRYYTETEINTKLNTINTSLNEMANLVNNINNSKIKYVTRDVSLEGVQEVTYDYLPKKILIIASLNDKACIGMWDGSISLSLVDLRSSFTFDFTHPIVFYTSGTENGIYAMLTRENNKLIFNWTKFGSGVTGNIQIGILGI